MTFWTDQKIEELKKLVTEDVSYAEIALRLGCSRNSAIGKAVRLKIAASKASAASGGAGIKKAAIAKQKYGPKTINVKKESKPLPPPPPKPKPEVYRKRVRLPPELHDDKNFELFWQNKTVPPINDILNIPGQFECKWIDGDVRSGRASFCRKTVVGVTSWCPYHTKIVYPPASVYKRTPPKSAIERK